ncbi:hypothetical protein C8J57DRAFT_305219 [Mycena rebaudengoi]|nr:hypothetical protein C8J57DRAFT_305219 [Mycena rebaudengoi]
MPNPSHPAYRKNIGGQGLVLRWSTAADKAGCMLLSCLAGGQPEGQENEFGLRYFEPYLNDTFYAGSSTNWALCVDTTPKESATEVPDSPYADRIRAEADAAKERVVALVYFLPAEFAFENDASRVPAGKAQIVACKTAYRRRKGGENIMEALFEMVNARAHSAGCAFMITSGIVAYYRTHGYEYALSFGRELVTHNPLRITTAAESSAFSLRPAMLADVPALERLVYTPRASAEIFLGVSPAALHKQLRWLLGDRPAPYNDPSPFYPAHPFFVLEKRDGEAAVPRIVAAAGLQNTPSAKTAHPLVAVHPLLWDGEEDASAVALAIAPQLVRAVDDILTRDDSMAPKLATIKWVLSDAHPLRLWLLAHELAIPAPETSRYESSTKLWINVPSLPFFLSALTGALNARLERFKPTLGATFACTLRIAESRPSATGAMLTIAGCAVTSVEPFTPGKDKPHVSLPRGALTQLLMGYAGWRELKALSPDVIVEPAVLPLVEVLFPRRNVGSTMCF